MKIQKPNIYNVVNLLAMHLLCEVSCTLPDEFASSGTGPSIRPLITGEPGLEKSEGTVSALSRAQGAVYRSFNDTEPGVTRWQAAI